MFSYAQATADTTRVSLKALGQIDFMAAEQELIDKKEQREFVKLQTTRNDAKRKKLKKQEAQDKALWKNSNHNPYREHYKGKTGQWNNP